MSPSDNEVIEAVRSGDKQAFGELITRYWGMVYQLAYHRLGETMLAEDRTQETFLQAFLSLEHLQNPAQFRAWLYGIALNVCKNYFRRQQWMENSTALEDDGLASPELFAETLELRVMLETAIARLSPANQEAILLYYYEGFRLNEIAEILGISSTAVKGRLHKSRQELKSQLAQLFPVQARIKGAKKMIPVQVVDTPQQIEINRHGDYYSLSQVLLFNQESRRALVLFLIEEEQALSIAQLLANYSPQRPRQHDFAAKLLQATGAELEYVLLDKLAEGIPFASLSLKTPEGKTTIDARPGEAIALALHLKKSLFVSERSWEKASPPLPEGKIPNRSGVQAMIERLDEMRDARETWAKQKQLEWADAHLDRDKHFREQAREIIDAAFS